MTLRLSTDHEYDEASYFRSGRHLWRMMLARAMAEADGHVLCSRSENRVRMQQEARAWLCGTHEVRRFWSTSGGGLHILCSCGCLVSCTQATAHHELRMHLRNLRFVWNHAQIPESETFAAFQERMRSRYGEK